MNNGHAMPCHAMLCRSVWSLDAYW